MTPHCVFQTLLRAKDNEVQYLKKEISCLQNEVQSLTKVRFIIRPPVGVYNFDFNTEPNVLII